MLLNIYTVVDNISKNDTFFTFMEGLYFGAVISALYSSKYLHSKTIEKTKTMKTFISFHNILMIVFNGSLTLSVANQAYINKYPFWNGTLITNNEHLRFLNNCFYLSKIYEFIDTFIMIANGNIRQVSFLHVYHHSFTALFGKLVVTLDNGGSDVWYAIFINSLVHVVMYSYYLMATLVKNKKYLFWGKYLTMFQLTQFVSFIGVYSMSYLYKSYPPILLKIQLAYMCSLITLFSQFYVKKWLNNNNRIIVINHNRSPEKTANKNDEEKCKES